MPNQTPSNAFIIVYSFIFNQSVFEFFSFSGSSTYELPPLKNMS